MGNIQFITEYPENETFTLDKRIPPAEGTEACTDTGKDRYGGRALTRTNYGRVVPPECNSL